MYNPSHFAVSDSELVAELVRATGFGHLARVTADGLTADPVPFVADEALSTVRMHVARANPVWRADGAAALLIVPMADGYVSPSWYPSKQEHGRVVPTWNYEVVHLHGHLVAHDDSDWLMGQINDLTGHNEAALPAPWMVGDAPADFIEKQRRAIVGLELVVDRVEAKRKLSQNRDAADHAGVVAGLENRTDQSSLAAMMRAEAADRSLSE